MPRRYNKKKFVKKQRQPQLPLSFECPLPKAIAKDETGIGSLFADEDFVLMTNEHSLHRKFEGFGMLKSGQRYLLLFNRYTRTWVRPIPFPRPFHETDDDYEWLQMDIAGFVHPRTFASVCFVDDNQTGHRLDMYIQLFHISETLDKLDTDYRIPITKDALNINHCVGLFKTDEDTYTFVGAQKQDTMDDDGTTIIYEDIGPGKTPTMVFSEKNIFCTYAMMHNGQLYLLCLQRGGPYLYVHVGGRLIRVRSFKVRKAHEDMGELLATCTGNRLVMCVCYCGQHRPCVNVIEYNITTGEAVSRVLRNFPRALTQHDSFMRPLDIGAVGGEILLAMKHVISWDEYGSTDSDDYESDLEKYIPGYVCLGGLMDHTPYAYGLKSIWAFPPKLGTLALNAVHQHMPKRTKDMLAEQTGILGPVQLAQVLYGQ